MNMKQLWDKVRSNFGENNLHLQKSVKQTYDLGMMGVITEKNATSELMRYLRRTTNLEIKEQILRKIEGINRR